MSTAKAIQNAVVHVSVGLVTGAVIESVMPAHSASSSVSMIMFEAFVQAALNGVAVSLAGSALMEDDPTYGLPFSTALLASQPELVKRIEFLGARVKEQVDRVLPKMPGPAVEAA
jgi:hypothetical protein